jgi:hypothetical protein
MRGGTMARASSASGGGAVRVVGEDDDDVRRDHSIRRPTTGDVRRHGRRQQFATGPGLGLRRHWNYAAAAAAAAAGGGGGKSGTDGGGGGGGGGEIGDDAAVGGGGVKPWTSGTVPDTATLQSTVEECTEKARRGVPLNQTLEDILGPRSEAEMNEMIDDILGCR